MKTMNMNVLLLCIAGMVTACGGGTAKKTAENELQDSTLVSTTVKQEPIMLATTTMEGYFLKNTFSFGNDSAACFVFPDKATFDQFIGVGKTMTNKIVEPDFAANLICAIALKATNLKTDIRIDKATLMDGTVVDLYIATQTGEKQTFTATPLLVFQLAKKEGMKTIHFIQNGQEIKTVNL